MALHVSGLVVLAAAFVLSGMLCAAQMPPTVDTFRHLWNRTVGNYGDGMYYRIATAGADVVLLGHATPWGGATVLYTLSAFNVTDGTPLWDTGLGSDSVQDQKILFASSASFVAYVAPGVTPTVVVMTPGGKPLWRAALDADTVASDLALSMDRHEDDVTVVVTTENSTVLIMRRGHVEHTISGGFSTPPFVVSGSNVLLLAQPMYQTTVAFDLRSAAVLWNTSTPGGFVTRGSSRGEYLAIGNSNGAYVLNATNGSMILNITTGSGFQVTDVAMGPNFSALITGMNMNFLATQRDAARVATNGEKLHQMSLGRNRGRNAYPSTLLSYAGNNVTVVTWEYNTDATMGHAHVDEEGKHVAFITADAFVVVNASTGAVMGRKNNIQDYNAVDRPASLRGTFFGTGCFDMSMVVQLFAVKLSP
jgi:hypothetical protein